MMLLVAALLASPESHSIASAFSPKPCSNRQRPACRCPNKHVRASSITTMAAKRSSKNNRRKASGGGGGRKNRQNMSNLQAETDLMIGRGYKHVIGSDEAGRGALAGPVVAASCCILTDDIQSFEPIAGVDDSKALTVEDRRRIYDQVINQPDTYAISVAEVSNEAVDEVNILVATMDCFRQSIEGLVHERGFDPTESYGIVDGKKSPKLVNCPGLSCRPWVKADTEVYSVAIASIVAKTVRDDLMIAMHETYPQYDFASNKGYNSADHLIAIHNHGACPIHRMSFAALKDREVKVLGGSE